MFKKLQKKIYALNVDAFLVVNEQDQEYLQGFSSEGSLLLVSRVDKPVYFINSMNYSLAKRKLYNNPEVHLCEVNGPILIALNEFCNENNIRKIAFNPQDVSVMLYDKMQKSLKSRIIPVSRATSFVDIIAELRQRKTDREIKILRIAAKKTVTIWRKVKKNIDTGMTEKKVAHMIDSMIKDGGYINSFPTIAAFAENSAHPHAIPTTKKLKIGEHLLVDFGMRYKGYCSDLTRTFYKGRINRQIMGFRKFVLQARDIAIKKIKPGIAISSIVEEVNEFFVKNNISEYILHGLGHGLGLNIHEKPFLNSSNLERFKKGMVITIEPGLYKKGVGGIREEDMILITAKGCEVLTV